MSYIEIKLNVIHSRHDIVITDIKIDARPYIVMSDFLTLQSFQ